MDTLLSGLKVYDPTSIVLKIDGQEVYGFSSEFKFEILKQEHEKDIHIWLSLASEWYPILDTLLGKKVRVEIEYVNSNFPVEIKEKFFAVVKSSKVTFGSEFPEAVFKISKYKDVNIEEGVRLLTTKNQ
jgi:hypothetical protein